MSQPLHSDESTRRADDLRDLMEMMAGEIVKDGGTVKLGEVDYQTGEVEVVLGGACGTCSLTGTTLEDGVVRILTQRLDWVTDVRGVVEEAAGVVGSNGWRPKL
jgi:Fe-S cluster biogenesis protein NfuA